MLAPWKKSNDKPGQSIKNHKHHFVNKGPYSQSYGFFSSYVWMWELDHKEGWALKNWCFLTVLEKTLESPLDNKEIKPVNPKGNHPWISIGRTDVEAEAPVLWPFCMEGQLIGKDSDAVIDWGWEEKGVTEDETVWWHHQLNGHEFKQTLICWRMWKPGMLQSMASERVGHNLATEQQLFMSLSSVCYLPGHEEVNVAAY